MSVQTLPDLDAIVDPILGLPYAQYDCWQLLRYLFREGWEIDLDADPALAIGQVQEVWFEGSTVDPCSFVQPWDVAIFRTHGMASSHVGIVVNARQFLHTRKRTGVCLEPLQRWKSRLMQIARLRRLL